MVDVIRQQQTLQGLARLVIYSYLDKRELLRSIRQLSKKDQERVDTSYIIRENKGAFRAKINLDCQQPQRKRLSVQAFDTVEVTVPLAQGQPHLFLALSEKLQFAQKRKTTVMATVLISRHAQGQQQLLCTEYGNLSLSSLRLEGEAASSRIQTQLVSLDGLALELCQTVKSVALVHLRVEKEYLWSILAKAPTDLDLELSNCQLIKPKTRGRAPPLTFNKLIVDSETFEWLGPTIKTNHLVLSLQPGQAYMAFRYNRQVSQSIELTRSLCSEDAFMESTTAQRPQNSPQLAQILHLKSKIKLPLAIMHQHEGFNTIVHATEQPVQLSNASLNLDKPSCTVNLTFDLSGYYPASTPIVDSVWCENFCFNVGPGRQSHKRWDYKILATDDEEKDVYQIHGRFYFELTHTRVAPDKTEPPMVNKFLFTATAIEVLLSADQFLELLSHQTEKTKIDAFITKSRDSLSWKTQLA